MESTNKGSIKARAVEKGLTMALFIFTFYGGEYCDCEFLYDYKFLFEKFCFVEE